MKNSNKGFTLIELILAMVILSIGLTGILSVMMTTVNNSVTPELRWQLSALGENIIETLLAKNEEINIASTTLSETFPQLAKDIKWGSGIRLSISTQPYENEKQAKLICVILTHAQIGDTHFCAIKTIGSENG